MGWNRRLHVTKVRQRKTGGVVECCVLVRLRLQEPEEASVQDEVVPVDVREMAATLAKPVPMRRGSVVRRGMLHQPDERIFPFARFNSWWIWGVTPP